MIKGNLDSIMAGTEAVAKEAEIYNSQPKDAVAPTPNKMAMGAAVAAPAVSSET